MRYNGKVFYLHLSPLRFHNSPTITATYLRFLRIIHSGEEEINGVYDTDVYEWVVRPFERMLAELAPASSTTQPLREEAYSTLHDYLFPEFSVCNLEALDENSFPKHIVNAKSGHQIDS